MATAGRTVVTEVTSLISCTTGHGARGKLKLFFVLGTRPEIIKMAPVVHECEARGIEHFLLHTGQHHSEFMSDTIFEDMALRRPDKNLHVGSGTHAEQTAKALLGIERELLRERPDVILVEGDTNVVLSGAIAAVKLGVPVGHIEAGLRSYDLRMPEEHNRRLADHASKYLFAPTERAASTLHGENVWGQVYVTGNTVIDALEERIGAAMDRPDIAAQLGTEEYALLTMHRAENVDDRRILEGLVRGLLSLDVDIVFPAHPRTVNRLREFGLMDTVERYERVHVIEPVGYLDMLRLMKGCKFVLTDSGGIQEEVTAPSLNKRAFVLRTSTERPEAVESGHATVVGVDPTVFPDMIREAVDEGLDRPRPCPYGDGHAAKRIIDILEQGLH